MTTVENKAPTHASNVYLFKNGYGMIVKTFEFPPTAGESLAALELIDTPAHAVHGTFWVQSRTDNVSIKSIRTKKTRKSVEKECLTLEDLIEANVGENVQLLTVDPTSNTKEWVSGTLTSVKRNEVVLDDSTTTDSTEIAPEPPAMFHSARSLRHPGLPVRYYPGSVAAASPLHSIQQGNLVMLKSNDGLTAISLSDIKSIRGVTLKNNYQKKVFTNGLLINYQSQSKSNELGLMKYLTFGLTWAPSYSLTLLPSENPAAKRLRLSSKAVILNDIENMHVDNLFCIVGFPNISKFASVIDPIIGGSDVQTFLNQLKTAEASNNAMGYGGSGSTMSNSIMTQQVMHQAMPVDMSMTNANQVDGDGDDLHLYEFKNVLLEKKERLIVPIFDIELPYKDVYHCEIKETDNYAYYIQQQTEPKDFEEVWHSIEFENRSNFVWTTAPVVVTRGVDEQQFVGQDKITYTLKGSSTLVNLTKALDVRIRSEESVMNTNANRFRIRNVNYQSDQIEGKIQLINYKNEQVQVVLKTSLTGKISNYSFEPKTDTMSVKRDVINEHHNVQWEISLKPKQTLEIKYVRLFNRRV